MTGRYVLPTRLRGVSSVATLRASTAPLSLSGRFSAACPRNQSSASTVKEENKKSKDETEEGKDSAMTRRLAQMTEDAMLEGGRSARRNIEHAGFSEELKKQLEERVAAASFTSNYAAAHSIVNMPAGAGQGTREMAAAPAWTGQEQLEDTTLRMLDDASKPIRMPYKIPQPVNLQPAPKPKKSRGHRLAEAKERTSTYALSQAPGFSEEERENMRHQMRENLSPGARSMPISISGLSSLADERIEDAIARGQFKSIRRGKGVNTETDHNANSAFIDTTEYFMNKIIQQQEIVPPWIEKQQQLASETSRFRSRLRADWKRHAAMLISSKGGSLEAQMNRAKAYAAAEIRLAEKAKLEASLSEEQSVSEINTDGRIVHKAEASSSSSTANESSEEASENLAPLPPLRDANYLAIERAYHELAVKQINSLARSYNLQAPPSARKAYLNLERELKACFAEVAPQLAEEIRRRATERARPSSTVTPASSAFGSLGMAQSAQVRDEDKAKGYGMKELWRDLFSKS